MNGAHTALLLLVGWAISDRIQAQESRPSPSVLAPTETVEELVERLRARAHGYTRITLPYDAKLAAKKEGRPPQWTETGVVRLEEWRVSIEMSHRKVSGATKWYEATWDGVEGVVRSGPGRTRDTTDEGLQSLVKDESWGRFPLSSSYLPHNFGVSFGHRPLGEYLDTVVADVRITGRKTFRGIDCVEVLFDMDGRSGDDGKYTSPWVLLIDDTDTQLALSIQSYVKRRSLERRGVPDAEIDELEVEVGDGKWVAYERLSVLDHERVKGVPVCTHGELACHELFGREKITVTVNPDGVRLGESFSTEADDDTTVPTRVRDNIKGEDYFLLPDGSTHPHMDVQFRSLLQGYAKNRGMDLGNITLETPIHWGSSSCGPDAIYFAGHILGIAPRLEELVALVPEDEGELNVTSLQTLGELAEFAGLEFLVVETGDPRALEGFDGVVIVHQPGVGGEAGHFGVVDFKESESFASVISPPHSKKNVPDRELLGERAKAYFMLLAHDESSLAPFAAPSSTSPRRALLGLALAATIALIGLTVVRGRRKATGLGVVAILLLIVVPGCKPSTASAASALAETSTVVAQETASDTLIEPTVESWLLGPMSKDMGEVDPGRMLTVSFEWMHVGDERLRFSADRASCQCTRFQFLDQDVEPGQIVRAEIKAVAPLVDGPFRIAGDFEAVDAHGETVVGAVLLHGTVPHQVFTYVEPDSLSAVRGSDDESVVELETFIVATCRSDSALPDEVQCVELPPGVTLEFGDPEDAFDASKGSVRRWKASISIDASDDRARGEMDRLRFVFSDDRRVGANLMLRWSRTNGYPLESKSAILQRDPGTPLDHRVGVSANDAMELLHVPEGLDCAWVEDENGTHLRVTEDSNRSLDSTPHTIVLKSGDDWPVSYSLVQHAVD